MTGENTLDAFGPWHRGMAPDCSAARRITPYILYVACLTMMQIRPEIPPLRTLETPEIAPPGLLVTQTVNFTSRLAGKAPAFEAFSAAKTPVPVSSSIHLDTTGNQGFSSVRDVRRT